jgi:type II secretory ATPase GspE/PulE/Tfp pilus assembly ATPase PilB-like protein
MRPATLTARGVLPTGLMSRLAPQRALLPYEEIVSAQLAGPRVTLQLFDGRSHTLRCSDALAAEELAAEIDAVLHPARTRLETIESIAGLRQAIGDELKRVAWLPSGLWELILLGAAQLEVQDLHLEAAPGGAARLIARREGLLHPLCDFAEPVARRLRNRLKVAAGLLSYREDVAQEGRVEVGLVGRGTVSGRVTLAPGLRGEQASIRLHDRRKAALDLAQLGFKSSTLHNLERAAQLSRGVIVISGPPASGKSTTMFALLRRIQAMRPQRARCVSLEDPIEVELPGVAQVQVDEARGNSYARMLQVVLRQDVDVIVVGEIRDERTAQLALEAGLTGHLVLTTLHAGTLTEAMTRLGELDGGVRLDSALAAVTCQRLERRGCEPCAGRGCPSCDETGFAGLRARGAAFLFTPEVAGRVSDEALDEPTSETHAADHPPVADSADVAPVRQLVGALS